METRKGKGRGIRETGRGDRLTDIIRILPLKPHRSIGIVQNHPIKSIQQLLRLTRLQLVDLLGKRPEREDALPPGHRVRAHDGVYRREMFPDIQRAATGLVVQDIVLRVPFRGADEPVADEGRRQPFEEFLVRAGEAVVDLVARGPERVAAPVGGELREPEGRVVRRARLELDVAVPADGDVAFGPAACELAHHSESTSGGESARQVERARTHGCC